MVNQRALLRGASLCLRGRFGYTCATQPISGCCCPTAVGCREYVLPIPTFDQMLRPILALAAQEPLTRRDATQAMSEHFKLSPEVMQVRLPSGTDTKVANRAGWAMTFLSKAGLIVKVAPRTYGATEFGRQFLLEHPATITVQDLRTIDGWEKAWRPTRNRKGAAPDGDAEPQHSEKETPLEAIDDAVTAIHEDVKDRLLKAILSQSPAFFERLVLDVLIAMGYGGSRATAAEHLGQPNDEGIDGRINQDPLGLDQIMVQAKRYAPENVVDRKTIQAFIGSLAGQGVTKGVFITTSTFAQSASEFVLRGSNTKVVLIDGEALLELMMRHKIGVRVERQVELLDLDQNYFNDAD